MKKENENPLNEKPQLVYKAIDLIKKFENEPEPVEIWNGIIEGSKGLFVGVSKAGKTTFAENFAISLAVGRTTFYGKEINGSPKKVIFVNLEESARLRFARLRKQISRLDTEEMKLFGQNYLTPPEEFIQSVNSDKDWQKLQDCIEESNADVVFIDSLTHLFQGQIESSHECVKFVNKFREYVVSSKKTIIVIHHNIKGNDRPIEQDNIAGSRVILQEFEYALGFANIPNGKGKYSSMLFNKYVEVDSSIATVYKIDKDRWIEEVGEVDKNDLYDAKVKVDYREDSTNKDLVHNYIQSHGSHSSHGSQTVLSSELIKKFVNNDANTMSKNTLYKCLDKLRAEEKIESSEKGKYQLKIKMEDGKADENSL